MIYQFFIKRILDLILALTLIFLLMPLLIIISALILIQEGKPILFIQERPGINKAVFRLYKFRTMLNDNLLKDKDRITKIGLFLRKYSLDELPQLINVIKGDMSLIGPRPLLLEYNNKYTDTQNKRFLVKPGISGLAQVKGRNNISWEQKFQLDVKYVERISLSLDCMIFFKTIYTVITSKGFKSHGEEKKFSIK